MIRHLPEGSLYVSKVRDTSEAERPELDADTKRFIENRTWTTENGLTAQLINAVNNLSQIVLGVAGQPPKEAWPLVGPSWMTGRAEDTSKPKTTADWLRAFGATPVELESDG